MMLYNHFQTQLKIWSVAVATDSDPQARVASPKNPIVGFPDQHILQSWMTSKGHDTDMIILVLCYKTVSPYCQWSYIYTGTLWAYKHGNGNRTQTGQGRKGLVKHRRQSNELDPKFKEE